MTLKTLTVKVLLALLLVGTASAAVYTIANEDGLILFNLSPDEPDGTPITTMVGADGGPYTNMCDFGELDASNGTHEFTIRQRNAGDTDYTSTVYFVITCDQGLVDGYTAAPDGQSTRGVEDFVSVLYTDLNNVQHECNVLFTTERISPTTVKMTPAMEAFTFVPGYVHYTQLDVLFNPLAHGNYMIEVCVV